jgi:dolichol-phosphate mannosyltransferase
MKKKEYDSSRISVIIPTYNEKENISKLVLQIDRVFKKSKINGRIIISDDNSPDGTGTIADSLAKEYPVLVIHRSKNRGYGNSIIDGLKKAIGIKSEIAITMDCDFSHDPKLIPSMIKEIKNYDLVIGSRRVEGGKITGWNAWRHFASLGATWFAQVMLGLKTKDITSGYRAYKTIALKKIPFEKIKSNGYSFLEELLYLAEKKKLTIKEIPIIFVNRTKGASKLNKKEILKFFITIFRLKFSKNYD